jgi:pimeloyl-ACP methyl ester carboxylesterase
MGLGLCAPGKLRFPPLSVDYRSIIYDRWGYGCSEPRSKLSMSYFREDLQDLLALLDHFKVEQASLVGHSDGGTLTLSFSAQHPERVHNLIIAAVHIYVEPKMEIGIVSLRYSYENDKLFQEGLHLLYGDRAETVFYNWYNGWAKLDNRNWDMRPIINKITKPTFVIQGIEDEHATLQHAQDIAEGNPGAELWLAQGARHLLPSEEPELFNKKLLNYLRDNVPKVIHRELL